MKQILVTWLQIFHHVYLRLTAEDKQLKSQFKLWMCIQNMRSTNFERTKISHWYSQYNVFLVDIMKPYIFISSSVISFTLTSMSDGMANKASQLVLRRSCPQIILEVAECAEASFNRSKELFHTNAEVSQHHSMLIPSCIHAASKGARKRSGF